MTLIAPTWRSSPRLRCPHPSPGAGRERQTDAPAPIALAAGTAAAPQRKTAAPLSALLAVLLILLTPLVLLAADTPTTQPARFETINVYVHSANAQLAAWQVDLKAVQGDVKIVGVEGGDHRDLYHDPPYYDPKALNENGGRIILASYTTSDTAPKGKTLVARIHLRVVGPYRLAITPMAAANPAGESIRTTASLGSPVAPPRSPASTPASKPSPEKE